MSEVKFVKIDLRKDLKLAEDLEEIRDYYRVPDYVNAVRIAIARTAQEIRKRKPALSKKAATEVTG